MKYPANHIALVLAERSRTRLRTSPISAHWSVQNPHLSEAARAEIPRKRQALASPTFLPPPGRPYYTGEAVPESGVYEVVHAEGFRERSVTFVKGQLLPGCEICGQDVSYRLVRAAPYIFHDNDFQKQE
jgi:hypothetical protein